MDPAGQGEQGRGRPVAAAEREAAGDFSFVRGGPVYRLLERAGLVEWRRGGIAGAAVVGAVITWLPLLLLAALDGSGGAPSGRDFSSGWRASIFSSSLPIPTGPAGSAGSRASQSSCSPLRPVGSARFAQQILHAGAHVADFKMVLGGFVAIATVVVFAPLAVFAPRLTALRRESHGEYSRLAGGHHRAFEARWLRRDDVGSELLGSPDVSSLADLDTAFQNVTALRAFPVERRNVAVVAVAAALPIVPLVMLEIPVAEILRRILGILA